VRVSDGLDIIALRLSPAAAQGPSDFQRIIDGLAKAGLP
jgi:hypothetical protein